jgi:FtsP/CotA-like multicopper oxidase with cupredoxin domain
LAWAGIVAGPALALEDCPDPVPPAIDDLPNPPELVSVDGVLLGTLTIAPAPVTVRGCTVVSNVINGDYLAPTLRVRRNDTIRVRAVNQIGPAEVNIDGPQPTNIHYHGMDVSPKRPGDNVFIRIRPEQQLRYDVFVPRNHPQGLHWYHAHVHHFVDDQISSGVSGMLIVDGFIGPQYPELAGLRQRVMVLKDFTFPGFEDGEPRAKSLNGFADPPIRARPGEYQLWQLGNLGADAFFDMQLDGHTVWLIERDGNLLLEPERIEHIFLPPGARAMVVVQAGEAGTYAFRHRNVDTGPAGDPNPAVRLGRFIVAGNPVRPNAAIAERLRAGPAHPKRIQPNPKSVERLKIDKTRHVDFSESADGDTFFINGKTYDEARIDTETKVGRVERWIVRNFSQELHVFHLHQTAFLIDEFSGSPDETLGFGLRDVINIPYAKDGKPGYAEIIIPFTKPIIAGEFVYPCHLVQHEDAGMMANILVRPKPTMTERVWEKVTELAGLELPGLWPQANATPAFDLEGNLCRAAPEEPGTRGGAAGPQG